MSSNSGIAVDPACIEAFQNLKLGKKVKYIIYKLTDDLKAIAVAKESATGTYDEFLEDLPNDDCRYAVFDFDYITPDGPRNKIVFFTWSPDGSKVKPKMIYASSKEAIRKALNGVAVEIQGTDYDEVAHDAVLEKIQRK
ncbi:cofilin [Mortierella alpina]|nr:cofilin [Mortierella alpina]